MRKTGGPIVSIHNARATGGPFFFFKMTGYLFFWKTWKYTIFVNSLYAWGLMRILSPIVLTVCVTKGVGVVFTFYAWVYMRVHPPIVLTSLRDPWSWGCMRIDSPIMLTVCVTKGEGVVFTYFHRRWELYCLRGVVFTFVWTNFGLPKRWWIFDFLKKTGGLLVSIYISRARPGVSSPSPFCLATSFFGDDSFLPVCRFFHHQPTL